MSHDTRGVSRRAFLGQLLGGAAATWAAGYLNPETLWGQTSKQEPQGNPGLMTRVTRPFDAETRVKEFDSYFTPNDRFFVRSHFGPPPPEQITEKVWRLHVKGLVDQPLELTMEDLAKFDRVSVTAVVQCSGNGRAFHRPRAAGVQWERGAVGNAKWTGVRLRDVLSHVGVQPSARHLQMLGADRPVSAMTPLFLRSIPIEKAMHPDTLLATHMNGEPLPLLHGAPLRLITPGWMGDACVEVVDGSHSPSGRGQRLLYGNRVPVSGPSRRTRNGGASARHDTGRGHGGEITDRQSRQWNGAQAWAGHG